MKARVTEGTVAAVATLVSSWPVTTLLADREWLPPTMLLVAVVAGVGMAGRALALRGVLVLLGQLVLGTLVASWVFTGHLLWYLLPGPRAAAHAGGLIGEAADSVSRYAAPAPTTPGLVFITVCSLGLVAVAVDYLAVTRRAPAMAGLPLLLAFLVSAANSGSALNPVYFLGIAAMWLFMLARQGSWVLRRWGTGDATPTTPVAGLTDPIGASAYAAVARSLGVVALVLAVALPAVLPHLPPTFLASGLGRNGAAHGGGAGTVGFTETLDMRASLQDRDTTPVLRYSTKDPDPPPLRVAVTWNYDSQAGRWLPTTDDDQERQGQVGEHAVAPPQGLSAQVARTRYSMSVQANGLHAPQVATPFPLVSGDFHDVRWWVTDGTAVTRAADRPQRYDVQYWQVAPSGKLPAQIRDDRRPPLDLPDGVDPSQVAELRLDPRSAGTVRTLAAKVTQGHPTILGKAVAIQDYLRDTSQFTYSLTLAAPLRGPDGRRLDPITHFLRTKQGYCVQFATAMVMMARAEGIPARMAIGFLPGDYDSASRVWNVTAADAHAWPELFLNGLGWTRFEPTPSVRSGLPPTYAFDSPSAGPGTGNIPGSQRSPAVPNQDSKPVTPQHRADLPGSTPATVAKGGSPTWPWLVVLALLVLVLGAAVVVPLAGRLARQAPVRRARDDPARVEGQWSAFTRRLGDLGIESPVGRTPRQLRSYYEREGLLDESSAASLGRALDALERARYAPPAPDVPMDIEADTRAVVRAVTGTRGWRTRLRATLLPRSGVDAVRAAVAGVTAALGRGPALLAARLRVRPRSS